MSRTARRQLGRPTLALVLGVLGGACFAGQARAATAQGTATATVVDPAFLVKTDDLRFGALIVGTTPGTVVVDSVGTRTGSGGVVLSPLIPFGPASFTLSKSNSGMRAFNISSPTPVTSITITSGANSMTVDGFTQSPANNPKIGGNTLLFWIGGTLHVGANQAPGNYTGIFPVTVTWE